MYQMNLRCELAGLIKSVIYVRYVCYSYSDLLNENKLHSLVWSEGYLVGMDVTSHLTSRFFSYLDYFFVFFKIHTDWVGVVDSRIYGCFIHFFWPSCRSV